MTFQGDPYRALGIVPGASLNEIRSAYRRLAKQYHPDAAGDRALPRFLAIQAAYERLVDSEGRLRPVSTPGAAGRRGSEAWRADAARARASREAWRARRAGATTTGGAAKAGGAASAAGAAPKGRSGPGGTAGQTPGPRAPGDAPPRERHGRKASRKATPGSTTYDEAKETPLDPEWEGGAWYGPSSNTYWTINPREYADPRKHGPEYLARARRAAGLGPRADDPATATDPIAPETEADGAPGEPRWGWRGTESTTTDGGDAGWGTHGWAYEEGEAAATPSGAHGGHGEARADFEPEPLPDLEDIARKASPRNLLELARRPGWRWRLVIALIAWPPVGYGVGTLISMMTGCAQFATSCSEPLPLLPLAVQPLIVGALFAVPPAAAVGASAALIAFAVAVPVAAVLSVSGAPGSRVGAVLLGVAVTLAYLVAMVAGAITLWRPRPADDDDADAPGTGASAA
jgi:curved DNA-binding protein CbpA